MTYPALRRLLWSAAIGLWAAAGLPGPTRLEAQNTADLSPRDKTEIFIQHLIKVARVDPSKYRALVLEYEIGSALRDLAHGHGEDGQAEHDPASCGSAGGPCGALAAVEAGDFLESALREIHPAYAEALELRAAGKKEEAREAARTLAGKADPYLAAHASLLLAELDLERAAETGERPALERAIESCERIVRRDRLYLIRDHRACELIALAFEKLEKPLQEYLQYAILLTDYQDLPADVERRAKEKLAALQPGQGRPLTTVANWMNKVEKLLGDEVTSEKPTQAQETEIVSALDKLIELQEARERRT